MNEVKNQTENTQTKVEVQVLPTEGKITITVSTDSSKLTKADAGRLAGNDSLQHDIWTSVKSTKCDAGKMSDIDVNIHEQFSLKMTKADLGKI